MFLRNFNAVNFLKKQITRKRLHFTAFKITRSQNSQPLMHIQYTYTCMQQQEGVKGVTPHVSSNNIPNPSKCPRIQSRRMRELQAPRLLFFFFFKLDQIRPLWIMARSIEWQQNCGFIPYSIISLVYTPPL